MERQIPLPALARQAENALCYHSPMANTNHLAKLKEGAEVWNRWRKDNSEVAIDLSGAELRQELGTRLDLSSFDLSDANLSRAKFTNVSLAGADLRRAKM